MSLANLRDINKNNLHKGYRISPSPALTKAIGSIKK